jgi:hypothetical protein
MRIQEASTFYQPLRDLVENACRQAGEYLFPGKARRRRLKQLTRRRGGCSRRRRRGLIVRYEHCARPQVVVYHFAAAALQGGLPVFSRYPTSRVYRQEGDAGAQPFRASARYVFAADALHRPCMLSLKIPSMQPGIFLKAFFVDKYFVFFPRRGIGEAPCVSCPWLSITCGRRGSSPMSFALWRYTFVWPLNFITTIMSMNTYGRARPAGRVLFPHLFSANICIFILDFHLFKKVSV